MTTDAPLRYDAFISYGHSDIEVVQLLHRGLHTIGRRLGQRSALSVYRDETNLELHPDLWGRVTEAIDESRWMIAVLSPAMAASVWCQKEIRYWVEARGVENLLLVLVDGELIWNDTESRFDGNRSSSAPQVLTEPGVFRGEPLYLDLRQLPARDLGSPLLRDKLSALAAPIHGVPREELEGIDLREQRRGQRLRRAAVSALVALTVLAVLAATLAVTQRNEAEAQRLEASSQRDVAVEQAQRAVARDLAGRAERLVTRDIGTARLYGTQAWEVADNPQTRAGLFAAVTASPYLARQHHFAAPVRSASLSEDLSTLTVALEGGEIIQRSFSTNADHLLGKVPGAVGDLHMSTDGTVVGVQWWGDSDYVQHVTLFRDGREVELPEDAKYLTVAPDSLTVAYLLDVATDEERAATPNFDVTFGRHEVHLMTFGPQGGVTSDDVIGEMANRPYLMRLSPDGRLVMVHADEHSTAMTTPILSTHSVKPFAELSRARMGYAPWRRNVGVLSAHGEYYYSGASVVPGNIDAPESTVDQPATGKLAEGLPGGLGMQPMMAVSPDGRRVVGGLNGELTVIDVGDDSGAITIQGSSQISSVTMPDGGTIVSADGNTVSIWNLDVDSSIVQETLIPDLEIACGAENCLPKGVYPNRDGSFVVVQGFLDHWVVDVARRTAQPLDDMTIGTRFLSWQDEFAFFVGEENVLRRTTMNAPRGVEIARLPFDEGEHIVGGAWLAEEGILVVASTDAVYWVDPEVGAIKSSASPRKILKMSPDGTRIITQTGEWPSYRSHIEDLSFKTLFSADGDYAFTRGHQAVAMSATPSGALRGALVDEAGQPGKAFNGRISSEFIMSPDGLYVLTQPSEREFLVSLAETGAPLQSFDANAIQGSANAGAFSADGSLLFLFDNSRETQAVTRMRTVALDPEQWVREACTTVARGLTMKEWEEITDLEPLALACAGEELP